MSTLFKSRRNRVSSFLNALFRGRGKRARRRQDAEAFDVAEFGHCSELLEERALLSAVNVGLNFTGSTYGIDSGYRPPDTMGDVGPNHIVELINGRFDVYNKTTGVEVATATLNTFWTDAGATIPSGDTIDPRVIYDHDSGRWFASSINRLGGNTIFVARSDTSDPTGDWDSVQFVGDTIDGLRFADYDTLSVDADGVYIGTNNFFGPGGFDVALYSIPKADLLLAAPTITNLTRFEAQNANTLGSGLQTALNFGASDGKAPTLGVSGSSLIRTDILGAGGAGATLSASINLGVTPFIGGPNARQPGGTRLENVTPRLTGNVVQVNGSLWAAHTVLGSNGNSAIRWYQIDESTNAILQEGTIEEASLDYLDPSIAVNEFGTVVVGATASGPDAGEYASAVAFAGVTVVGGDAVPVTTFQPMTTLAAGVADYDTVGSSRNRWGDYSATRLDPSDSDTFWTFQEFASATNIWSIRVSELSLTDLDIVIDATGGDDDIDVSLDPTGSFVEIEINGVVTDRFSAGTLNSLTINALGGDDTITVNPGVDPNSLIVDGGGGTNSLQVLGTSGDDGVAVFARDSSTHPGADGVQDFTVSLNQGIHQLFIDFQNLLIDTLGGFDGVFVVDKAPNQALWSVTDTIQNDEKPTITGPSGTIFDLTPTITWNALAGAAYYEILLYDKVTGGEVHSTSTTATSSTVSQTLLANDHEVFVRGVTALDHPGTYTKSEFTVALLTATTFINPPDTTTDLTETFSWDPVAGADKYEFLMYNTVTGMEVHRDANVAGTSHTVPQGAMNVNQNIQIFVRALTAEGEEAPWSAGHTFSVIQLAAPTITSGGGTTEDTTPSFAWTAVADAATYKILVYDINSGQEVINTTASGTSYTTTPLPAGEVYKFYVAAVTEDGGVGVYAIEDFNIPAPAAPTNLAPSGTITDTTPTITWNASTNATNYSLLIYNKNTGMLVIPQVDNIAITSYTLLSALPQNPAVTYQVFVRGVTLEGVAGAWSAPTEFIVV